jgi:hypothetical protein
MEVTWHADEGMVILSLWQDRTCRSTFRLPIEDAPALIGALAAAIGDAMESPPPPDTEGARPALQPGGNLARLIGTVRQMLAGRHADVVALHPVPQGPPRPES